MARPAFEITDEVIKKAERLASTGCTMEEIAASLGIGESTLYRKKAMFGEFEECIKKGRGKGIADVANTLYEAAMAGNIVACMFYLKCRANWNDKEADDKTKDQLVQAMVAAMKEAAAKVMKPI